MPYVFNATRSTFTRLLIAVAVLGALFAVPTADAASPTATGLKQLKALQRSVLRAQKTAILGARSNLYADLGVIKTRLAAGGDTKELVLLFGALETFQVAARQANIDARTSFTDGLDPITTAMDDAGVEVQDRPRGFFQGDGGVFDQLEERLTATTAKVYVGVRKRLAKLPKLFEKRAGIGMTVRLQAPPFHHPTFAIQAGGGVRLQAIPLTVDVLVAGGLLTQANDVTIRVAGSAHTPGGDVQIVNSRAFGGGTVILTPDADDRWSHAYFDQSEEDRVVSIRPVGEIRVASLLRFGVR